MSAFKDYSGRRFGRLVVINRSEKKDRSGGAYWDCVCDCGNTKTVSMSAVNNGYTKSCGCLRRESLQNSRHKDKSLYQVWQDMKQRCLNPRNAYFYRYGGRGIFVCHEWLNDYESFYEWAMQNGYARGLQIDRIENNGNYSPDNCRWVSAKENTNNREVSTMVSHEGRTQSLADWSKETGIALTTLRTRHKKGYSSDGLFKPTRNSATATGRS